MHFHQPALNCVQTLPSDTGGCVLARANIKVQRVPLHIESFKNSSQESTERDHREIFQQINNSLDSDVALISRTLKLCHLSKFISFYFKITGI